MHRLATVHARDNQRRHDTAYLNKRLFYKSKDVRRLKMECFILDSNSSAVSISIVVQFLCVCVYTKWRRRWSEGRVESWWEMKKLRRHSQRQLLLNVLGLRLTSPSCEITSTAVERHVS